MTGAALALGVTSPAPAAQNGPVTPAGWRIAPVGREFGVSKFEEGFQGPVQSALSPDGKQLLAASSGASRFQSADLFDLDAGFRTTHLNFRAGQSQSVFYGVAWSPADGHWWMSGGGQRVVHVLSVVDGTLTETRTLPTPGFAAGLAYGETPLGPRIYVVNNTVPPFIPNNPPGHTVTVIDPVAMKVTRQIELGIAAQPLGVAFARDGRTAIVTNWIGRSISVIDTATEQAAPPITLADDPLQADHPSAVVANPERDEAYIANANADTVSVVHSATGEVLATIPVGLMPGGPKGATPDGLAVSPEGSTLYVALGGENAVAVVDLDARAVRGFLPTSWYPSDVEVTPDGRRLVITNTNDSGAGPNRCGPNSPLPDDACGGLIGESQNSTRMIKGSIQVVDVPGAGRLADWSNEVRHNNRAPARGREMPQQLRAIKHVFYVIKENRTYDQLLGDMPEGNGDPELTIFGDGVTPNQHALARRFGLFDAFFADAEVTADGHSWITQANATDYVDKTWPFNYSPSRRDTQRDFDFGNDLAYPWEPLASDPNVFRSAAAQTVGYLWDNAWAHGVTFRNYGEMSGVGDCTEPLVNESIVTHLQKQFGTTEETFPGYNLACSDHVTRLALWETTFDAFEENGDLPALSIMRLANDHTEGTGVGKATPESYVADNDMAVGRLVDVISHSRYWKDTAIFVTEDDAQNGPDHVDAHRTMALAISAYNKRPTVDSTHYDTASMVATIEDLLGLPPMSISDERAPRMWHIFRDDGADFSPYDVRQPQAVIPFDEPGYPVNGQNAPLAEESATWDFSREDATPELALNRAIWKSVKGRDSRMPKPKHKYIIGSVPNDEAE
jgi:YVTN family beta-propeller protein